jgi:hypothetical protein
MNQSQSGNSREFLMFNAHVEWRLLGAAIDTGNARPNYFLNSEPKQPSFGIKEKIRLDFQILNQSRVPIGVYPDPGMGYQVESFCMFSTQTERRFNPQL